MSEIKSDCPETPGLGERIRQEMMKGSTYELLYQHTLMRMVLEKIANCSDDSTLEGVRGLAQLCLNDVPQAKL